jgi:histidinol phosphatase-like PHP family hydrolase
VIDLHSHTLLSDGDLLPAELARRCEAAGYRALAFTDHVDSSTMEGVLKTLLKAVNDLQPFYDMRLLAGIEITHCPPDQIAALVADARKMGAHLVLVHGETLAEPVKPGTNKAAILAGADILAHPGLISAEEAALAAEKGVCLEISARSGHSLSNGHVAAAARRARASLTFGTDTHSPENICPRDKAERIARGAGLGEGEVEALFKRGLEFFGKPRGG